MSKWLAVLALAGALGGCDAKASTSTVAVSPSAPAAAGPTYTERVKIDDV